MGNFDNMFKFSRLFLDFGCKEQGGRRDGVSVKSFEGVEHVKPLHVNDCCVDAKLCPEEERKNMVSHTYVRLECLNCAVSS